MIIATFEVMEVVDGIEATGTIVFIQARDGSRSRSQPQQGEVLAVGPGRRSEQTGEIIPMDIAAGDTVVYSKYGGTEITLEGDDYLILNARDVLAKVGAATGGKKK